MAFLITLLAVLLWYGTYVLSSTVRYYQLKAIGEELKAYRDRLRNLAEMARTEEEALRRTKQSIDKMMAILTRLEKRN